MLSLKEAKPAQVVENIIRQGGKQEQYEERDPAIYPYLFFHIIAYYCCENTCYYGTSRFLTFLKESTRQGIDELLRDKDFRASALQFKREKYLQSIDAAPSESEKYAFDKIRALAYEELQGSPLYKLLNDL